MKIWELAIKRPVATLMMILMILILGGVALMNLNIELLPELELPIAATMTSYSSAGPEEVERLVTKPIEETLSTVENVDSVMSISQMGSSMVLVYFNWGTDMNNATRNMQEKLDFTERFLPEDVEKPLVFKMDPTMFPVIVLGMHGNLPEQELKNFAEDILKNRLERVNGVAAVDVLGGKQREIKVSVYPDKLQNYNLSLIQVIQSLQAANLNASSGSVTSAGKDLVIRVTGEFEKVDDIRRVGIDVPGGGVVRLGDIAEVEDGTKDTDAFSMLNGEKSVGVSISKQTDANTVSVSKGVRDALAELESTVPPGIKMEIVMDQAEFVQDAIDNVVRNIVIGGLLSVLVLFIFLRSLRSTLVIGTSIPISVIAAFVLIYFAGQNLNLMTLGGLALGVGMMVDNSIVVLENIFRHRQTGKSSQEAASFGTGEVAGAVIASTLTTVAVFLPIVFTKGMASILFSPLAIVVAFSLAASLLVSLTFVPMLSSRLQLDTGRLPVPKADSSGGGLAAGKWLEHLDNAYVKILRWTLGHRKRTIGVVVILFIGAVAMIPLVGVEFLPSTDQGQININVNTPRGTQAETTREILFQVQDVVQEQPETKNIFLSLGDYITGAFGVETTGDNGSVLVQLDSLSERKRSTEEVVESIRKGVTTIPGAKIEVTPQDMMMGSEMGGSQAPLQISISGEDLDRLEELGRQVVSRVEKVPGTAEVSFSLEEGRPRVQIKVDRERAAEHGLQVGQVATTVKAAVQGQVATRYRTGDDEIDVLVNLTKESRDNLTDLSRLMLSSPRGYQVPLEEIAELKVDLTPNNITREDRVRTVSVSAQLAGRTLGEVQKDVENTLNDLKLPEGYWIKYGGQIDQMRDAFGNLSLALILAVILVYVVMAAQFESLLHPLVIMFSLPLSFIGVVPALALTGRTFCVTTFIGVIMLAGIVVNNAIVLVDYINILRRRDGLGLREAILRAGPTRLRPILMTSMTTILGLTPLVLGIGEGSEVQAPMATAVIGGLLFSTLLTLVVIPLVYSGLEDLGSRIVAKFKKRLPARPASLND